MLLAVLFENERGHVQTADKKTKYIEEVHKTTEKIKQKIQQRNDEESK